MYCPRCRCEFAGWTKRCPDCRTPLVENPPPVADTAKVRLPYAELVNLVRDQGGQVVVALSTTDVGMDRKWGFPYFGYGFAWAKRMHGAFGHYVLNISTTEVRRETRWRFPWLGSGYAWAKTMSGRIGGNQIELAVTKVSRDSGWTFPYFGQGFAWAQELSGHCGDELEVNVVVTDVGRKKAWRFPYLGHGYAWARAGGLTLQLAK